MTTQQIKVQIGLDGASQVTAGANQAGQALTGLADKVQRFGSGTKVTGQQTAQLSAQLQDFFVQVQAGGSPLTAFIQQGSQLSAVFGGFGNAARAVAALITPTVAAIGAAAAAIGTVGYAYVAAQREQEAFRRSIVLTGNAAGATAGQLNEMAKAAAVGSRGTNADTLAQLVASGQVAVEVLAKANEAAVRLERDGGVAIKDTVAAFAELGRQPLQALERLNQTQNFLTLSTYKQVAALVEQGRAAEAAQVAQEAYAAAGIERSKQLAGQIGLVERAWRGVIDATNAALNAVRSIGADAGIDEVIAQQERKVNRLREALRENAILKPGELFAALAGEGVQQQLDAAEALLDKLRDGEATTRRLATAERERALATRSAIASEKQAAEDAKRAAKERETALKRAREEAERLAAASIKAGNALLESMALESAGLNPNFLQQWEQLNAALRANPALNDRVRAAQAQLVAQQPFVRKGLEDQAKAQREAAKAQADYLQSLDKTIEGNDRELQSLRDRYVEVTAGKAALEDLVQARLDDAAAQAQQALQAAELVGANDAELDRLGRIAAQLRDVAALRRTVSNAVEAKDVADASAAAARKAATDWDRTAESIRDSLTDGLRRAFESGEDFGTAMAKTIANELKARLATALAGALADNVLALAGVTVAGQQGGNSALGGLSAANSLGTLYSAGSKAYSLATGGVATTGAYGQFVAGYKGATLAAGQAGPTTAGATGAMGVGSTAGSSASWLSTWGAAIAAGVYKANQDYSQGFRRDGAREVGRSTFGAAGSFEFAQATILSKLGFSDRLADLLSGATAVAKLIGYSNPTIRNAGISGAITGGDFAGNATAEAVQKAGVARKLFGGGDKVTQLVTDLPEDLGRFLDAGAAGVLDKAKAYGQALGLPVENLGAVAQQISIKADETGKITEEALIEALAGYGDALVAGFADAVAPLAAYGETTAQTIERVGGAITGVNEVLEALGLAALAASIDGGKAALALQDMFGGVDQLQGAAGSFLQNFYSEAERAELTTNALAKTLGEFGLQVPATRDAFRGLVQAQDLTTESGREAFTALLAVSDAFASITPAARSAADILAERQGLERELLDLLGDTTAIRNLEREALDESNRAIYDNIRALEDQAAILAGLSSVIDDFVGPRELATFRAGEVQSTLAGGGIAASVEQILGSNRGDIVALWQAVGDEGKAAILEAYGAWQDMHEAILAADIAAIVEPLGTTSDALLAAYQELVPAADDLVGSWRSTRDEVQALSDALAEIDGTAVSAIDRLRKTTAQRDGLQGVISGNSDRIFDLRVGQGGRQAVDLLKQREAQLWTEFASTNSPEVARAITQATLQRIALEGELQADVNATQIDALKEQISAAERLRDLAAEMGNFVLSLQAGNLSNLGYQGRLAASESLFANSLTTGENVQGNATSLLQNAQSVFGGATGAYSDVFESVTGRLRGIGMQDFGAQISEAQAQLNALQSIDETADAQIAALTDLNSRFGVGLDSLNTQVQAQTDAVREQVTELRALQANQERQILQFGLALTRLIEASERTATAVESTADAVELEAAAP